MKRSNPKQIEWSFETAKKILSNYISKDLQSEMIWMMLMSDCNSIVERTGNDLLTEKLVLAVCQYLEEVERAERGDKPVLIEKKVAGFTPVTKTIGFEVKGFKVGE